MILSIYSGSVFMSDVTSGNSWFRRPSRDSSSLDSITWKCRVFVVQEHWSSRNNSDTFKFKMVAVKGWPTYSSIFLLVIFVYLKTGRSEQDNMNAEIVYGVMVNSCICKVDGKVYNLTETGKLFTGKWVHLLIDFFVASLFYRIKICQSLFKSSWFNGK